MWQRRGYQIAFEIIRIEQSCSTDLKIPIVPPIKINYLANCFELDFQFFAAAFVLPDLSLKIGL